MTSLRSFLALFSLFCVSPVYVKGAIPDELFSPLIPQKVFATTNNVVPADLSRMPYQADGTTGDWGLATVNWWTGGFFPATLYAVNTRALLCTPSDENGLNAAKWLELGRHLLRPIAGLSTGNSVEHDQGFMSLGLQADLLVDPDNQTTIDLLNNYSRLLSDRWVPTVGVTRSWGGVNDQNVQVIIDNMVNLELFYVAADLQNNQTLRDMAESHANVTAVNHIREDGSTWHVVEYDQTTGEVISKHTAQGYSDDSTWSRGQSWGVWGFANMYRRTGIQLYLDTARRLADYFITNLPDNNIVPWDFNAPTPASADSSAAAIVSNGLLILADVETDRNRADVYIEAATTILDAITDFAWKPDWESLLSNATANMPQNDFDTGIVYGDYYYIEAGNLLIQQALASC